MKRILLSLMTIALVAVMAVGGAFAFFYDTEVSEANVFTAGTLDLQLADGDEWFADGVTATWKSPANWAPGETVTATISLRNVGTVDAMQVHVDWTAPVNSSFLRAIQVTEMSVATDGVPAGLDFLPGFVGVYDANGDGKMSLWELITGDAHWPGVVSPWEAVMRDLDAGGALTGLPLLPPGVEVSLTMGYTFMTVDVAAGGNWAYGVAINGLQGATAEFDVVFMATQHKLVPDP